MKVKVRAVPKVLYHSAETMVQACSEDYKIELESYNKIYEKINITLAFCGAVLMVILGNFDLSHFSKMKQAETYVEVLLEFLLFVLSLSSFVFIFWSTIQLLRLMRGSKIKIFDSLCIRNDKIYTIMPDRAALWLIGAYTESTADIRMLTSEKQRKYDNAVMKLVVAVMVHAIYLAIHKGV